MSEALKKAQKKYDQANSVYIGLKLNRKTDADIIEWISGKESKMAALKIACRTLMEKEKEK